MSTWELHIGARTWKVGPLGLVIGRGAECDVVVSDPSISRRHAVIQLTPAGGLTIDDPGSRHGTRVNGVRVAGPMPLHHSDRIAISEHTFVVFDTGRLGRERAKTATVNAVRPPDRASDPSQTVPNVSIRARNAEATSEIDPAAMLLVSAEDALARGDATSCGRDLGRVRDIVLQGERAGGADAVLLRRFAACALRAASGLSRSDWVDAVVDLHSVRPRVMHAATIDALEGAFERLTTYDRTKFNAYVARVRDSVRTLGTYERFCLDRLLALSPR